MRGKILVMGLLTACASPARSSNLDVTAFYRLRAESYNNLNLDLNNRDNRSFFANDAELGLAVRKIYLETRGGEDTTMDVGVLLHAVGVSGSTATLSSPFDRAAANYPSSDLTPFIE